VLDDTVLDDTVLDDTVLDEDMLDEDTGLHPATMSAVTARMAATVVPRQQRTRIVKPPSPSVS